MLKETIDKFKKPHLICDLGVIDEHDFGDELNCLHFGIPPISLKINYRIKGLAGDYVVFVAVNEACNGLELCWGQETKDDFKVGPIKAGFEEIGPLKVSLDEVSPIESGGRQISAPKVRPGQVCIR